ncbi:MAG TPA: L-serine ammonia-lyase, iron-sulfur-dependent, subunit alpha [Clostridia bacterium]|nr:L-serine ammonia-lyase, iron-sulfur-dependent, subunit alpha [Clostridia bacterium]
MLTQETIDAYCTLLHRELIPATGCTEPIAIAYAAALLRKTLGALPERMVISVSGNILKNAKSVVVPGTGGRKGIAAAAAAGVVAGDSERLLEVIDGITDDQRQQIDAYLKSAQITVACAEDALTLDIRIFATAQEHSAFVRIAGAHTNVVRVERDGKVLLDVPTAQAGHESDAPEALNTADIVAFADTVDLDLVRAPLLRQLQLNLAIAEFGMSQGCGANIGRVLLCEGTGDLVARARAYAAAGSDARMSGAELPVVIVSGSGNQGITASVPVAVWARERGFSEDALLRALIVSDLVTIHQKTGIGRLSAFCGAVCAGCGAGAGIAYLEGCGYDGVAHAVVNALAIISGMVCDGAKASCAAKIAVAVDAGILGYRMYTQKQEFVSGDGIVVKGVDNTIRNIGRLAKDGMRGTETEILSMMLETETR